MARKPVQQPNPAPKNEVKRVYDGIGEVQVRKDSFNEENRTVEIIFSTGAAVKRYSWDEGYYMEVLEMSAAAVDLARLNAGASFLNTHNQWDMADRLGAVVPGSARIEKGQGICTVKISRNPEGERLMVDLRDGMPLPISVGYKIHEYRKKEGDETALPIYTATRWEPMEVSAVPVPADFGAHARSIHEHAEKIPGLVYEVPVIIDGSPAADAARNEETHMTDEDKAAAAEAQRLSAADAAELAAFRAAEQKKKEDDKAAADEAARLAAEEEAKLRAANTGKPLTQAELDAAVAEGVQRAIETERARTTEITTLGQTFRASAELVTKAINGKVTVAEFRGMILDEMRLNQEKTETFSVAPQHRTDNPDQEKKRQAAVAGAILHRVNPTLYKLDDDSKYFAHRSLLQLVEDSLSAQGVNVRGMSKNELSSRAFHTTSDFPVIMDQVVNRVLRESYKAQPQLWRQLGKATTAPDFKQMQSIVDGQFGDLQKVNEHGEFKRTTFTTGGQSWGIATYGMIFGVTRQALINDSIGLFQRIPQKFTNSVIRTESTIAWDIFLKNPKMSDGKALFHADHGNLAASGSALSIASLTAARLAMQKQKDFEGKYEYPVTPKYLVVPPELEYAATQLVYGTFSPVVLGETIPDYVRSLVVVVEPKLSVASGPVPWYLVADPNVTDTFDYAYLEGENGPFTDQRVGFDIDGQEWKIRLDFGAAPQDHRGFYKNPGVAP